MPTPCITTCRTVIYDMPALPPASIACVVASVLCVAALLPMPYGFYTLVRIATAATAIAAGIVLVRGNQPRVALLAWALAILYNPILRVYLEREVWMVLNVLSAAGLGFLAARIYSISSVGGTARNRADSVP
jgi:hypothetical protein